MKKGVRGMLGESPKSSVSPLLTSLQSFFSIFFTFFVVFFFWKYETVSNYWKYETVSYFFKKFFLFFLFFLKKSSTTPFLTAFPAILEIPLAFPYPFYKTPFKLPSWRCFRAFLKIPLNSIFFPLAFP